jgi:formate/nitrite transporter FocA (FNT family)
MLKMCILIGCIVVLSVAGTLLFAVWTYGGLPLALRLVFSAGLVFVSVLTATLFAEHLFRMIAGKSSPFPKRR